MPKRIHIGSLGVATTAATLTNTFSTFGTVVSVAINLDPTGGPIGSAELEYTSEAAGSAAITTMNGATLDGATISVTEGR